MADSTVQQGRRYRASILLGFFESLVSNETIAARLSEAGFSEVIVSGSGATRSAEGLWPQPDTTAPMPSQVASVVEIA